MTAYRTTLVSGLMALLLPLVALGEQDLRFALRAVPTPTAAERIPSLPVSMGMVGVGATYYVELWVSDVGTVNSGVTSAYVDMTFDDAKVDILTPINHGSVFTAWPQGVVGAGLIDEIGGSTFLGGVGAQPEWAKVATVRVQAVLAQQTSFGVLPGNTGCAAYGRGLISPSNIDFGPALGVSQIDLADIGAGLESVANASLAWGDYDNDGNLDLAIAGQAVAGRVSKIYRNMGDGTFTAVDPGLVGVSDCSLAWADFDNDGDLDLAIAGESDAGPVTRVYRNDGAGAFSDLGLTVTGVSYCSLAWADYDGDGHLDLAVAGQSASGPVSLIYRNSGTPAAAVFTNIGASLTGVSHCALAWADYDNDGRPDLALAGDNGSSPSTAVYRNEGAGVFTAISSGIVGVKDCSVAWADSDNDGNVDLAIAGTSGSGPVSKIYRNAGGGVFVDSSASLTGVERCSLAWGDFDGDGDLDLAITGMTAGGRVSKIYSNDGGAFSEVGMTLVAVSDSAVAWADFDNDNDLDLAVAGNSSGGPVSEIYRISGSVPNTKPLTPGGFSASQSGPGTMTFNWLPSSDGQTPVPGLSYNLRVGTSPGADDLICAMAQISSGFRRIPATGNAFKQLSYTLSGLTPGKYYASVQAVDTSLAGSLWSAEKVASVCDTSRRYVKADAPPSGDGCSWGTASSNLQEAVTNAAGSAGAITEIWVAAGTYTPTGPGGNREATFQLVNGVGIYGGFAGTETQRDQRDPAANVTILSGDLNGEDGPNFANNGENSYHIVTGSGTDATAILDGFTITAGHANGTEYNDFGSGLDVYAGSPMVSHCSFVANLANNGGAGACFHNGSAPTLNNCTFWRNMAASEGGGMAVYAGSNPTLMNCTFRDNSATADYGGGVFIHSSNAQLSNCRFDRNTAGSRGGGLSNITSSPSLKSCVFERNVAGSMAGGMYNAVASPVLVNCEFKGNAAHSGGGVCNLYQSNPALSNCVFVGNVASLAYGGAMVTSDGSQPLMVNCSVVANQAATMGGGIYCNDTTAPIIRNNIFWGNTDSAGTTEFSQISFDASLPHISYTCIQGWSGYFGGVGSQGNNPHFRRTPGDGGDGWGDNPATTDVDEGANDNYGDLHLLPGSACIDAGSNALVLADTLDLDGDSDITEPIPLDLGNSPRFVDDPYLSDTGSGSAPIVDMGAYEGDGTVAPPPVLYVKSSAAGNNNGTSWADAFNRLQDAISVAGASRGTVNEIWAAAGTYRPTGSAENREATFQLINGMGIYGGCAGTEAQRDQRNPAVNVTTLSGDLSANDGTLSWTMAQPATSPSARYTHAMVYDLKRGVIVLCGGSDSNGVNGETWEWDGSEWHLRTSTGPTPRGGHAMVYDSCREVTVLFGGNNGTGALNDTWEWDGSSWSLRATSGPPARQNHALVFDTARCVSVLFGGEMSNGGVTYDDTWEWDGSSWQFQSPSQKPSRRLSHAMAYDVGRGVTVLYGGHDNASSRLNDTWEWNGANWIRQTSGTPSGRNAAAMAYDSGRGIVVLFGGWGSSGILNEVWEWDGAIWTQQAATSPSRRQSHAMAYDSSQHTMVVFGGSYSALLGDTWQSSLTLSFSHNGENSYHVVTGSGTDATAVLDGFTITGGNANHPSNDSLARGGGMYNDSGSPSITDCVFSGNYSDPNYGAGVCNINGSSPTLTACTFSNNEGHSGGGMANFYGSNPTLTSCVFQGNKAHGHGGGMVNLSGSPTLINCTFTGNSDVYGGAGMSNWSASTPLLISCEFNGNYTSVWGGGMLNYNEGSNATLVNCTFVGNKGYRGGAICNFSGSSTVTNCTFTENTAILEGGGVCNWEGGSPTMTNCILWGNSDSGGTNEASQMYTRIGVPAVAFSCIQGLTGALGGTGNIGTNPLFTRSPSDGGDGWGDNSDTSGLDEGANDYYGDLRLRPGSACIDAGNNAVVPADTFDLDQDGNTSEPIPVDLVNQPRFVDVPASPDSGNGPPPIVDIGAFESDGAPIAGAVLHVKSDATGSNDGTSWTDAILNLRTALTIAQTGDEIWVASGTYRPTGPAGNREATFQLVNGVGIYGGFAGIETTREQRNPVANVTILSGDLNGNDGPNFANNGENSYHVVTGSGTTATAILDGFIITGGNANSGGVPHWEGAGLYNVQGSPTVTDCCVRINFAQYCAGVYNLGPCSPAFTNCAFTGNSAVNIGGGMYNSGAAPMLTDCTFSDNTAYIGAGMRNSDSKAMLINCTFSQNAAVNYGGGMSNHYENSPILRDCTFSQNTAGSFGGGMANRGGSKPALVNCTFLKNAGGAWGGGMCNDEGSVPSLAQCIFTGNTANYGGGLGNMSSAHPILINCTFSANTALDFGGGIGNAPEGSPDVTISNCIFWDNSDAGGTDQSAQIHSDVSVPVIQYSCIQGWTGTWSGPGNIGVNPQFVRSPSDGGNGWGDNPATSGVDEGANDDYGDLRLLPGSPCIDAASNAIVAADIADLDADDNTTEPIPFDLGSNPRFVDAPATTDTGLGTPPIVDMGAFEFSPPLDADGDGVPDPTDQCPQTVPGATVDGNGCPPVIPGDHNRDGDVDQADLDHLEACASGAAIRQPEPNCADARLDEDEDVDQDDFGVFQRCYSGENVPADPDCAQ